MEMKHLGCAGGAGLLLLFFAAARTPSYDRWEILVAIGTLYVLFLTLLGVLHYAELTAKMAKATKDQAILSRLQLDARGLELHVANKPIVFLDTEIIADRANADRNLSRYVVQNVGPGVAINVHIVNFSTNGTPEDIDAIAAIEARGSRVISARVDVRLEEHASRMPGRVVVAQAMKTRTVPWVVTLNVPDPRYLERYVAVERAATAWEFVYALGTICRTARPRPTSGSAPLGDWRVTDIVTDTIERFREVRRAQGTGPVGVNRNVRSLRALFNWAIRVGYVEDTPFKRGTESVVKLWPEPKRSRRLDTDTNEEARLLAACNPFLRADIEAALETGMRRGEILSLQWHQIAGMKVDASTIAWASRAEVVLPFGKTKTRRHRRIPISTRLRAVLELRRFDPAGAPLPSTAYVFGNAIGGHVKDITRAWTTAVLKAYGHTPTYTKTKNLTPESRAVLASIDLHFHDLRRECGSRWLEGGVPLHTIRDWLGHTSIAQTSTYLAGTMKTQHDAMRQYEERRASLQELATDSETGGRKRQRTAARRERKPNKTAVGRQPTVM